MRNSNLDLTPLKNELKNPIRLYEELDPELHNKLLEKGLVSANQESTRDDISGTVEIDFEDIKKIWLEKLKQMEEEIEIQINDPEVIESGFVYPKEKFFDPFKEEVMRLLDEGEIPDIGMVGYGSLGSARSAGQTVKDPYIREWVVTEDIQRGLFLSHFSTHDTRKDDFWSKKGVHKNNESGEMAIRHKEGQKMNGVRMSNLSKEDIKNLGKREFPYFMLPIGPTRTPEGKEYKLNVALWPIGRHLTKKYKGKQRDEYLSLPRYQRDLSDSDGKKDREMFETAHSLHLKGLKPDIHYTEVCLDIGDSDQENMFLDTTFVPMSEGDPITLREYLEKHAPDNDTEKREYFGERLQKKVFKWNDKTQKFIFKKTASIKTTDPLRKISWHYKNK